MNLIPQKPVLRDTTPNSLGEILRRIAFLLHPLSILAAIGLAVAALAQRDSEILAWAWACVAVFAILQVTRRWWKPAVAAGKPAVVSAPASSAVPSVAPVAISPAASTSARPRILILNASLAGESGNTAVALARARRHLEPVAEVVTLTLARGPSFADVRPRLEAADAVLIGTGTHWDSWSSVLQKLLEDATPAEGTTLWLGKPAAVVVTEHSVGGKGVLSRLQGVLVTLGCTLPPMSGLVLARAAQVAGKHAPEEAEDFWCGDDLAVVCHNLAEAAAGNRRWRTWPVDRTDFHARWLDTPGG